MPGTEQETRVRMRVAFRVTLGLVRVRVRVSGGGPRETPHTTTTATTMVKRSLDLWDATNSKSMYYILKWKCIFLRRASQSGVKVAGKCRAFPPKSSYKHPLARMASSLEADGEIKCVNMNIKLPIVREMRTRS